MIPRDKQNGSPKCCTAVLTYESYECFPQPRPSALLQCHLHFFSATAPPLCTSPVPVALLQCHSPAPLHFSSAICTSSVPQPRPSALLQCHLHFFSATAPPLCTSPVPFALLQCHSSAPLHFSSAICTSSVPQPRPSALLQGQLHFFGATAPPLCTSPVPFALLQCHSPAPLHFSSAICTSSVLTLCTSSVPIPFARVQCRLHFFSASECRIADKARIRSWPARAGPLAVSLSHLAAGSERFCCLALANDNNAIKTISDHNNNNNKKTNTCSG